MVPDFIKIKPRNVVQRIVLDVADAAMRIRPLLPFVTVPQALWHSKRREFLAEHSRLYMALEASPEQYVDLKLNRMVKTKLNRYVPVVTLPEEITRMYYLDPQGKMPAFSEDDLAAGYIARTIPDQAFAQHLAVEYYTQAFAYYCRYNNLRVSPKSVMIDYIDPVTVATRFMGMQLGPNGMEAAQLEMVKPAIEEIYQDVFSGMLSAVRRIIGQDEWKIHNVRFLGRGSQLLMITKTDIDFRIADWERKFRNDYRV